METATLPAKKNNAVAKKIGVEAAIYACVFLLTAVLFLTVKPLVEKHSKGFVAQTVMGVAVALCLAFIAYMGIAKRLTTRNVVILLLIIGFIMRVGYMLYTPASSRQHDTFSKNFDGHEAYAWTIFSTGKLPTTNVYQFYHPPLNALLQAGFMKFVSGLSRLFSADAEFFAKFAYAKPSYVDEERYFLYSACQILSVTYSMITAVVLVKMLNLFSFTGKTKVLLAAFLIFYPRHFQFAGQLNNDGLSYLFATLALYYALKWWKGGRKLVWILLCGLSVGLGMMTKLSSATICLPIAGIFIWEFIQTVRKKENATPFWRLFAQYAIFLCICAPIGLWFQVYAKVRFDQNFGYVFDNLNRRLYTGDHSWFARFVFPFDRGEFFNRIYCYPFENYYLFNYALRSSIFGEFSYARADVFACLAVLFAYLVAILLFVAIVWCVVAYIRTKKKGVSLLQKADISPKDFFFAFALLQSQVISEIYFYVTMPYGCTMDFRYIMPMILAVALTVGCVKKMLVARGNAAVIVLDRVLTIAIVAFLATSVLFYLTCA